MMRRALQAIVPAIVAVGCNGDEDPMFIADLTSDVQMDGTVIYDPVVDTFAVTSASVVGGVSYGLDEATEHAPEHRGFLSFPLADALPADAGVRSAQLELYIEDTGFASSIPSVLGLVPYPLDGPTPTDYDSLPLESQAFEVFASDRGVFILLDVTDEVRRALDENLLAFQVRLELDPEATQGYVQIADDEATRAPLLTVSYE